MSDGTVHALVVSIIAQRLHRADPVSSPFLPHGDPWGAATSGAVMSATVQSNISTSVSTSSGSPGQDEYSGSSFESILAVFMGAVEGDGGALGANAIADATAFGDDTLASLDLTALVTEGSHVSTALVSLELLAAAQGADNQGMASTAAIIELIGSADVALTIIQSSISTDVEGHVVTTVAQTEATLQALQFGGDGSAPAATLDPASDDVLAESIVPDLGNCGCDGYGAGDGLIELDGNLALYDIFSAAAGSDTFVDVSVDAIAIDDQFSSVAAVVFVIVD